MKNLLLFGCVIILSVSTLTASDLVVIHGSYRDAFSMTTSLEELFDVIEIDRGGFHDLQTVIVLSEFPATVENHGGVVLEPPEGEEKDVILLLLPMVFKFKRDDVWPMRAISYDRKISVLPYSKELWEEIISKSDEELLGKLPTEQEAWKCAYDFAIQSGAHPEHIYASYPRENLHGRRFKLYYWEEGRLYDFSLQISPLKNIFIPHEIVDRNLGLDEIESFLTAVYGKNPDIMPYRLGADGLPVFGQGEGKKEVEP
jgi:hypothetical protein